jgi:MFS family permease
VLVGVREIQLRTQFADQQSVDDRHGPDDRSTEAGEQQWLTTRFPDREVKDVLRAGQRRRAVLLAVVMLAALVIGLVAGMLLSDPSGGDEGRDADTWRLVLGMLLLVVGVVVEIVGLVALFRRGKIRENWRSPLLTLPWRKRRHILRQMRGHTPVVEDDAVLVRGHAERVARQKPITVVFLGVVLIQLGQLLNSEGGLAWFMAVAMAVVIIASGFFQRDVLAARRFLDDNPAPAEEPVS